MAGGRGKLRGLHPDVRAGALYALEIADFYSIPVTVTSGFRSWTEQNRLRRNFEQCLATGRFGNTADCMFPANRPGESSHNFGLSWDSTVAPRWQSWWNEVRRWIGFEVLENDLIHAQIRDWRSLV